LSDFSDGEFFGKNRKNLKNEKELDETDDHLGLVNLT
jgi:hypothetical protein